MIYDQHLIPLLLFTFSLSIKNISIYFKEKRRDALEFIECVVLQNLKISNNTTNLQFIFRTSPSPASPYLKEGKISSFQTRLKISVYKKVSLC